MGKVSIDIGAFALLYYFNTFFKFSGLKCSWILAIFGVASRKTWGTMAVRNTTFTRRSLYKIIDSDYFNLRSAVILPLMATLCRLSDNFLLFLSQKFGQFINFHLLNIKLFLPIILNFDFDWTSLLRQNNFEFFALFLQIINFLLQHLYM